MGCGLYLQSCVKGIWNKWSKFNRVDRLFSLEEYSKCNPLNPGVYIGTGKLSGEPVSNKYMYAIGPLHHPVTWYKITYTGEQVVQ